MKYAWLLLPLLMLAACARPVVMTDETTVAPVPKKSYLDVATNSAVYRVDPQRSLILVRVGRDGPAARLGHDHAIASESVQGFVELHNDSNQSRADLAFPLRELIVDKAAYRERLELDTEPSEGDIRGTYQNMLKVVSPEMHPWVTINASLAEAGMLSVSITLNGRSVNYLVPASIRSNRSKVTISGQTVITHEDFGLSPFSAAGGLLRVAEELQVFFEISATRLATS